MIRPNVKFNEIGRGESSVFEYSAPTDVGSAEVIEKLGFANIGVEVISGSGASFTIYVSHSPDGTFQQLTTAGDNPIISSTAFMLPDEVWGFGYVKIVADAATELEIKAVA